MRGDDANPFVPPQLVQGPELRENTRKVLAQHPRAEARMAARLLEVSAMPCDVSNEEVPPAVADPYIDDLTSRGVPRSLDNYETRGNARQSLVVERKPPSLGSLRKPGSVEGGAIRQLLAREQEALPQLGEVRRTRCPTNVIGVLVSEENAGRCAECRWKALKAVGMNPPARIALAMKRCVAGGIDDEESIVASSSGTPPTASRRSRYETHPRLQ